jgi:hypothetical protein
MARPFVHTLNEEFRSIAGWYALYKEDTIEYDGKQILFLLGEGAADSACCGSGACRYALVPGVVLNWKNSTDDQGRPISLIEPLVDPEVKEQVKRRIMAAEGVPQVQFW